MSALAILWYFLVFLLIAGYFILDGFDLGVGTLYPFLCKTDKEKMIARRSIGPVWDGNEVWLLTAGGALFAAFPDAYATTFSGFYLAIMLVLFSLIVRAVSFEFYQGDPKWRGVWNVCFFLGSALPSLLFGVALGNVIAGIPMDSYGNYIGIPLLGLITPFTLLTGVLGLLMFMTSGACWLALKAPLGSELQKKAAKLRFFFAIGSVVVFVLASIWWLFIELPMSTEVPLMVAAYIFAVVYLLLQVCVIVFARFSSAKNDLPIFIMQSASACFLVFLVALSMFPVLVNASVGSIGEAITIMTAGSSELSLFCMTVILCIGLPLVLVYHFLIYRTFRGRVEVPEGA